MVHIFVGEGAEESLPSVLLSLSGEDGYQNNSIFASGGEFNFENLFPGSFFLRPLLKVCIRLPILWLLLVFNFIDSPKQVSGSNGFHEIVH